MFSVFHYGKCGPPSIICSKTHFFIQTHHTAPEEGGTHDTCITLPLTHSQFCKANPNSPQMDHEIVIFGINLNC